LSLGNAQEPCWLIPGRGEIVTGPTTSAEIQPFVNQFFLDY
jgi:hypothetical protein